MEIWKDIAGCGGQYQVSNYGRVRSLKMASGQILKPSTDGRKGYLHIKLYTAAGPRMKKVHRLVADAFIPNPDSKPQVNHINGNKADNRVENLEWATQSENQRHRFDVLHQTAEGAPPTPIICVETGTDFRSISEAARALRLEATNICKVCKGQLKTTGGYHFRYKE